jgi:WD40 repeat protein
MFETIHISSKGLANAFISVCFQHCAGINCLAYLNGSTFSTSDYLFSGSRDGTLKRWELNNGDASFSATFESHVDWVGLFLFLFFYSTRLAV